MAALQRLRDLPDPLRLVGVAGELRLQLQPALDPVDPCGDLRREGEVGVQVRPAHPALDPDRRRVRPDQPVPRGPVVPRPDRLGRREGPGREPLVAVDIRRQEQRPGAGMLQEPRHPAPHHLRHAVGLARIEERRLPVRPAERQVQVARRPGLLRVVLRHEGDRLALRPGDLLHRVLHHRMRVRGVQHLAVADVDLLLPGARLALGILHRDAGRVQPGADRPHHILLLGGLEDVIVLVVRADRARRPVPARVQLRVGVGEEEELQLRRRHRLEARDPEAAPPASSAPPAGRAAPHGARGGPARRRAPARCLRATAPGAASRGRASSRSRRSPPPSSSPRSPAPSPSPCRWR